jgi:flagellar L-ring protein precursor FlgH
MARKQLVTILACALCFGAAEAQAQKQKKAPKVEAYDAAVARHLETARALARASESAGEPSYEWISSLSSDRRALSVNDLVTVRVIESIEAVGSADSALKKESSASAAVPKLFGLPGKLPSAIDPTGLADTSAESQFKGGGSTTRSSQLSATMTTRVTEVLTNGDLVLEGVRELELNGERQVVVLTGIVRPRDVRRDNSVFSTQVAQLRIQYYGRGLMKDSLQPGWLLRILNKIF